MTFLWKILINEQHITHWKKKCILLSLSFVVAIYRKSLSDLNVSLCQIFIESDILIFVVINRMHVFLNILTSRKYNLLLSHVECRRRIQEFLKNSRREFWQFIIVCTKFWKYVIYFIFWTNECWIFLSLFFQTPWWDVHTSHMCILDLQDMKYFPHIVVWMALFSPLKLYACCT